MVLSRPRLPAYRGWTRRKTCQYFLILCLVAINILVSVKVFYTFRESVHSMRSSSIDETALRAISPLSNSIGRHRFPVSFRNSSTYNISNLRAKKVPNIIHFIFGIEEGEVFGLNHYLSVSSAHTVQNPVYIYLHYVYLPTGFYWDLLSEHVEVRRIQSKDLNSWQSTAQDGHKSISTRLKVLKKYGGIYLDFDIVFLQPLDNFLNFDFVVGQKSNTTNFLLSNTLIVASKDSNILGMWLNLYSTSNTSSSSMNSNFLPGELIDKYRTDMKILDNNSILWPTGKFNGAEIIFENGRKNRSNCLAVHLWGGDVMKIHGNMNMMELLQSQSSLLSNLDVYLPTPLFSVIIPCHNQRQYINEAIRSVLSQSWPLWEIIVVDDNSPDNCGQYVDVNIAPFLNRRFSWPSIRVLYTGKNVGLAQARNIGIAAAFGSWICALDADDTIGPEYFREAEKALTLDPDLNIIYSNQQFFENSKWLWKVPIFQAQLALTYGPFPVMSLYPRKLWSDVNGYSSVLPYGNEDYDFWMKLMEVGVKGYKLKGIHTFYRYKIHSMMRDSSNFTAVELAMLRTRHSSLHTLDTVLAAHNIISRMSSSTFQRVSNSQIAGTDAAFQLLWCGLYELHQGSKSVALSLFSSAINLQNSAIRWQPKYYYAVLHCHSEVFKARKLFENLLSEYPELKAHREVQQHLRNCGDITSIA